MCIKSKDNYCCDRKSLLIIEINHIVVDEPHLLLRVTDILTDNLTSECLDWDKEDNFDRERRDPWEMDLRKLLQVIT